MEDTRKFVIGFDLGGTKMISALLEKETIKGRAKCTTNAQSGIDSVVDSIIQCIHKSLEKAKVTINEVLGIGIAVPGVINRKEGIVVYTPNLGFNNFNLLEILQREFQIPIILENDVNAGVYGEYSKGAARGYRHIVGIFPGTGIGGGLILDGKLYHGATGNAGEIGHMIIQNEGALCGCGQYGCLEAHASRRAMAKEAVAITSAGGAPLTLQEAGTDFKRFKSKVFANAYERGEESIKAVVKKAAYYLGIGMANCVNIFNPEVIVLGGGLVEKLGKEYVAEAEKSMRAHALPALVKDVKVVEASLGDDAIIYGAANIARDELIMKNFE
ncbi:MAG: ROK family protein [Spirochaetota bacterium]